MSKAGGNFLKRAAATAVMLLGAVIATFVLTHVVPSNPAQVAAGSEAGPQQVAAMRHKMGLDQPLLSQLWLFLKQLAHGDFGQSFVSHRAVGFDIALFFPATLELVLCALVIMLVVGLPLGLYAAFGKSRRISSVTRVISYGAMGVPPFIVALVLQIVLFGIIGLFPSGGRIGGTAPTPITGFYTVDALLTGQWSAYGSAVWHLLLPGLALALCRIGLVVRYTESEVRRALDAEYIRTARAKGVHGSRLVLRHVARNVLMPIATVVGLQFGWMLGGTILVEAIFSWPGLGTYILNSIAALDFNPVIISTLVLAAAFAVINLLVDVVHLVADPRVRRS